MSDNGFHKVISKRANVDDTLALIIDTINTYSKSTYVDTVIRELGPVTDKLDFIKRVFDFYCRTVKYQLDDKKAELVTTPALTIAMGIGDCKKASVFLASVFHRAGIEPILKHVYYDNTGKDTYTHIYVIVPYSSYAQATQFTLDPYLTTDPTNDCRFNSEVNYKTGTLYFLNGKIMELHQMGNSNMSNNSSQMSSLPFSEEINLGCSHMGADFDQVADNMGAPVMPQTKGALPTVHAPEHLAVLQKLAPSKPALQAATKNIPIDQQRGAFLELIKNNVDGISTNLLQVLAKDPNALNNVWHIVGGDTAHLKTLLMEGAKQKAVSSSGMAGPDYIGFSFKNFLHGAANVLHAIAPIASAIIPGAGAVINGIANKAESIALSAPVTNPVTKQIAPPPPLPPDLHGTNIPFGTYPQGMVAGSAMGSMGGFFFKSMLLISYNVSDITMQAVLSTSVSVGLLVYWLNKKYKFLTKTKSHGI